VGAAQALGGHIKDVLHGTVGGGERFRVPAMSMVKGATIS
jgi:hypothetical protein